MPESPIRKLVPYSEIAKKKGHKVYHLNIGQPDIKTPEVAMNSIKNLDIKVLEYSHSAGFESYRTKLAAYYTAHGLPINTQDIIITTAAFIGTCIPPTASTHKRTVYHTTINSRHQQHAYSHVICLECLYPLRERCYLIDSARCAYNRTEVRKLLPGGMSRRSVQCGEHVVQQQGTVAVFGEGGTQV